MTLLAEELLQKAHSGEKLSPIERRHCVAYIFITQPEVSNSQMASIFKVSESTIVDDIKKVRESKAKKLKEDDIKLVIADIVMSFEQQLGDLENSKRNCRSGSRDYLEHCKAIFNLQTQKTKLLQDLGFYPKDLGKMQIEKYEFKAVITQGGSIISGNINDPDIIELSAQRGSLPASFEIVDDVLPEKEDVVEDEDNDIKEDNDAGDSQADEDGGE